MSRKVHIDECIRLTRHSPEDAVTSAMEKVLTVEDSFFITGRGLVIIPDLESPQRGVPFNSYHASVVVRLPSGSEQQFEANFSIEHFVLTRGGGKWRIVAMLPCGGKDDAPKGSKLLVSRELFQRLSSLV